jgi:hypothetical protein
VAEESKTLEGQAREGLGKEARMRRRFFAGPRRTGEHCSARSGSRAGAGAGPEGEAGEAHGAHAHS